MHYCEINIPQLIYRGIYQLRVGVIVRVLNTNHPIKIVWMIMIS